MELRSTVRLAVVIALGGAPRGTRTCCRAWITNDIGRLAPGKAIYAALLTPQGKIVTDFLIAEGDGALLLGLCSAKAAEGLVQKAETVSALESKIEIAACGCQLGVYVGLDASAGIQFADPRLASLGPRTIAAIAEMPAGPATSCLSCRRGWALGVPESGDFGSDKIFALDGGLDELHAIAFDKGCYVGQEMTARMKHRGTARKRPLLVKAQIPLPAAGTEISDGATALGEMISTYGSTGFALIRLDRLAEAKGALTAAGIPITLEKPDWLCLKDLRGDGTNEVRCHWPGEMTRFTSLLSRPGMGRAGI